MSDNGYTTPDEAEAYARGYAKAQRNHDRANRVAAFGAIRRAAEKARLADEDNSYTAHVAAQEIRCAIRAAIRSPKA